MWYRSMAHVPMLLQIPVRVLTEEQVSMRGAFVVGSLAMGRRCEWVLLFINLGKKQCCRIALCTTLGVRFPPPMCLMCVSV